MRSTGGEATRRPGGRGGDRRALYRPTPADRPRRAPDHHPPPRRARSTTRCGAEPLDVGSIVRVPFGRQALDGVVVGPGGDAASWRRSGCWRRSRCAPTACRPTSSSSRCGSRTSTARRPARALTLVLPPRGRPRTALWAERTDAPLDGERLTAGQRALLERAARPARGPTSPRCGGSRSAGSSRSASARAGARRARTRSRTARSSSRPSRRRRSPRSSAAARTCCTASPARARPRSTCARRPRRSTRGEGVIVLVPEIALTPQTVARFQARFGDTVAVLHSALGEGERYDEWRRLRTGEARIAVGPRSAVFAPVADLGLVVVDEEHDASYKHEGDPRYDARTRRLRARAPGRRAAAGRHRHAAAGDLARAARLCAAATASTRGRCRPCACSTCAARATRCTRRRAARWPRARKSIVLLNRRGWSNFLTCRDVREGLGVPALRRRARAAPRRARARLPPLRPPRAGAGALRRVRLAGGRPPRRRHRARSSTSCARRSTSPVFRLDADTARGQGRRRASCWRASRAAPAGLLLGTQMVAKGHDFPDVTLGVVLDADSHAALPRLPRRGAHVRADRPARGPRRARAGRAARVLVQTAAPDAPSIARRRPPRRRRLPRGRARAPPRRCRYPPFADLIRVVTLAPRRGRGARRGRRRGRAARGAPGAEVLGPAPLFRLRDRERFQVVRQDARPRPRRSARSAPPSTRAARTRKRAPRASTFSVDVDPQ